MISFFPKNRWRIIAVLVPLIYVLIYVGLSASGEYVLRRVREGQIYDVHYPTGCFYLYKIKRGKYGEKLTPIGYVFYPLIALDIKYFNKSELAYSIKADGYWVKPERQDDPVY